MPYFQLTTSPSLRSPFPTGRKPISIPSPPRNASHLNRAEMSTVCHERTMASHPTRHQCDHKHEPGRLGSQGKAREASCVQSPGTRIRLIGGVGSAIDAVGKDATHSSHAVYLESCKRNLSKATMQGVTRGSRGGRRRSGQERERGRGKQGCSRNLLLNP